MKKKGFTLIELLAVIVVLAIIALIATPIVMNVISNAQKGAAERSADNYVKAVETLIATKRLDGEPVEDGTYEIDENGNLEFGTVELSGTKPNGGSIKIENGQVVKENTSIKVGDYTVVYEDGVASIKELAKLLDVCSLQSSTPNVAGAEYRCNLGKETRSFYVLEAGTASKPATLMLIGNYDLNTLAWCTSGNDNSCDANGLNTKLDEISEVWAKLDRSQIGIPSANQIAVAEGLDDNSYTMDTQLTHEWLYDWGGSCEAGYWTSTPDGSDAAWIVDCSGSMYMDSVNLDDSYGVRPIITLGI
ncbi:MAG: type II secretion system protein [Firmicutes bacterium]|nr:type II secretion system protein [Bacillota bacterium]